MTALVLSRFTASGIQVFNDSPRRIRDLITEWEREGITIKTAEYIIEGGEFDTLLRVEVSDLVALFIAVKNLEQAGNVRCKIMVTASLADVNRLTSTSL
jgi:uncharacterized protein with GYD domain